MNDFAKLTKDARDWFNNLTDNEQYHYIEMYYGSTRYGIKRNADGEYPCYIINPMYKRYKL